VARLCYPIANSSLGYEFCKGYYPRYGDVLYGRVTRLFLTPLIRALIRIIGHIPFLDYLDSFRYPLAGEFSMTVDLARVNRIPADWGLEVGVLSEVYRNCSLKRVCQVDLVENYQHKHQELSPDDPEKGLMKMSVDIADSLLRTLAVEGVLMSEAFFRTLSTVYQREAEDIIRRYHDDAAINGLMFDRHAENQATETFRRVLQVASTGFLGDPHSALLISNWNRVASALPDFPDRLYSAVEEDNEMVGMIKGSQKTGALTY
jgi:glucosyl-3-phosphoglycerate synthase